jgi:hypothetical protein
MNSPDQISTAARHALQQGLKVVPFRSTENKYAFARAFPTDETIQQAYDDADLSRAIEAYKFFYPTVSWTAGWKGGLRAGAVPNKNFLIIQGNPSQVILTANSDTPYAIIPLDLSIGPMVVELPPGGLMCVVNDLNQRYVMDMGLPGPDEGKGGKHVVLPPGYKGPLPHGFFSGIATTHRVTLAVHALPTQGDMKAAVDLIKSIRVRPLNVSIDWPSITWNALGKRPEDFTAFRMERSIDYWKELHEVIDQEPVFEAYRMMYGELATLGIVKGKPFNPDVRMQGILEKAAQTANDQMRVQAFADRRPDRIAWPGRKWEWACLRPENGTFDRPSCADLEAREKWFFQAILESPAMFRRNPGTGSLYWLGLRDSTGAYLDGGKTYKLTVPLPVPAKLFWSVTAYDAETRSEIQTRQDKAALRSLFELKNETGSSVDLYFGPNAPSGKGNTWILTNASRGWFAYFRIYGPEASAFDGSWKPGDFEQVK